jgi:tRNA (adenine57-N1/adenine58-N1)-methyltransferase catalytic subunit
VPPTVASGDAVLLLGPDGERHIVRARPETVRVAGLGVVALGEFVGKPWGATVRLGLKDYRLTRPVLPDHLRSLERRAQIVTPKDAARILFETGLAAGGRVLEAGVGSGALTLALAHAVAPSGRVIALDLREDHLAVGRRNLEAAGLAGLVDFRVGDVRRGVAERDLDAAVLDIPDPEAAIAAAASALRPGGVLAVYAPLINQAQAAAHAARAAGLAETRVLELIERTWTVHERGARPDFEMLGHTGFLLFARRL